MTVDISNFIDNSLKDGYTKIYPVSEKFCDMGFYMLIHPSTRLADTEGSYQCTLFLNEVPYCHDFIPLWSIKAEIEDKNHFIEGGVLHSVICDESIIKLSELSEMPNNKKIEEIHSLINKYNDQLFNIDDEKVHNSIELLFKDYTENNKYSLDDVENILKSLLK